jgi:hypothetical protein
MLNTLTKLNGAGIDTTLVLLFLTIEYARAVQLSSIEGILMGTTILMITVLPYFLPSNTSGLSFSPWLAGRVVIVLAGFTLGYGLRQTIGIAIPASVGALPMTFLILTGMTSCYLQFYGLMKLRLAK